QDELWRVARTTRGPDRASRVLPRPCHPWERPSALLLLWQRLTWPAPRAPARWRIPGQVPGIAAVHLPDSARTASARRNKGYGGADRVRFAPFETALFDLA